MVILTPRNQKTKMDPNKSQVIERINKANNVLISVSRNPSVDQLSAAIGMALVLNKLGKHAVAVFSGVVPSTIEFLQPEKTFEKTTDSLRDFIISLDKTKADKLRYKVENNLVRVFITPYRTSLTQEDLEFSQGDFNVDVVLALGVHEQADIDQAITAHGRILHDATVIAVNKDNPGSLGSINWAEPGASSLCEMLTGLSTSLKEGILDNQMATALLTGIVAETDRFSNDKTSPKTMQASSVLMTAGANQQLVASKLQEPELAQSSAEVEAPAKSADGSLEITHEEQDEREKSEQIHINDQGEIGPPPEPQTELPSLEKTTNDEQEQFADSSEQPNLSDQDQTSAETSAEPDKPVSRGMALEPPTLGGRLTANTEPEPLDPSVDIVGAGAVKPLSRGPTLSRTKSAEETDSDKSVSDKQPSNQPSLKDALKPQADKPSIISPPQPQTEEPPQSLSDLEKRVDSPHLKQNDTPVSEPLAPVQLAPTGADHLAQAREAVSQAAESTEPSPEPIQALNAQPIDLANPPEVVDNQPDQTAASVASDPGLPPGLNLHGGDAMVNDPTAPPAVPPPILPPQDPNSSNPQ